MSAAAAAEIERVRAEGTAALAVERERIRRIEARLRELGEAV